MDDASCPAFARDVGIRPFGYITSMVATIALWLAVAPAVGAIARAGRSVKEARSQPVNLTVSWSIGPPASARAIRWLSPPPRHPGLAAPALGLAARAR